MSVLPVLSASFETIDHDHLFCILEKYVGICGNVIFSKFCEYSVGNRSS